MNESNMRMCKIYLLIFFLRENPRNVCMHTTLIYFSEQIDRQSVFILKMDLLHTNIRLVCMCVVCGASNSDQRTRSTHIDKVK